MKHKFKAGQKYIWCQGYEDYNYGFIVIEVSGKMLKIKWDIDCTISEYDINSDGLNKNFKLDLIATKKEAFNKELKKIINEI